MSLKPPTERESMPNGNILVAGHSDQRIFELHLKTARW